MDLDIYSCAHLLKSSVNTHKSIIQGRQIHLLFLKRGVLNSMITIANRVLHMYVKCGHMNDAENLFDEMPQRNCFTWNSMIEGYLKSVKKEKSLHFFYSMPCKNEFAWNLVVSGFVKMGEFNIARRLFNEMPVKTGIAWNSIIHGYARSGDPKEAVRIFKELSCDPFDLSRLDTFVFATVVRACTDLTAISFGKQIHARIVTYKMDLDSVLASSLINLYGKCGDLDSARNILNSMCFVDDFSLSAIISGYANCGRMEDARSIFVTRTNPCVEIWNTMIAGYVDNDYSREALFLFNEMRGNGVLVDCSTFSSVLSACGNLGILEYCKQLHTLVFKFGIIDDLFVSSAIVDTYSKCGCYNGAHKLFAEMKTRDTVLLNSMITIYCNCGRVEEAERIFDSINFKTLISWNSMIVGYTKNGRPIEALNLFHKMTVMGLRNDKFSLAGVISACASISSLELGEQIFAKATVTGLESDDIVSTSLIDLYCKCGFVENGRKLFNSMKRSEAVPWNSMLIGYATNGYGIEALDLFNDMISVGIIPTNITFTGVLSACDHCGLVEEGQKWFHEMKNNYHIDPQIEHYSCMVDLFSRAGFIEKAIEIIEEMPFDGDVSMWSSVLRGCVAHGNNILGKKVAEKITYIDPENSDAYVQLSSIFASSGEWEKSAKIRKLMREKSIQKVPGYSWAEC